MWPFLASLLAKFIGSGAASSAAEGAAGAAGSAGAAGAAGAGSAGAGAAGGANLASSLSPYMGSTPGQSAPGAGMPTQAGANAMGSQGLNPMQQMGNMARNPQAAGAMAPQLLKTMGNNAWDYLKMNPPKMSTGTMANQPQQKQGQNILGATMNPKKQSPSSQSSSQLDPKVMAQIMQYMKGSGGGSGTITPVPWGQSGQ